MALDLSADLLTLTRAVVDVPSVSGDETALADLVAAALRACPHLVVDRDGDTVVARTHLGRDRRAVVAGHLDTVPVTANLPSRVEDGTVWGRGTVDMKAGVAVMLSLAAELTAPTSDVTWVFYDHEEVAAELNGLGRVAAAHPQWLAADFAVLCEPTDAGVEGGCNGTLRAEVHVPGVAAHSARAWTGVNAIHRAGEVLRRLAEYRPATVTVDSPPPTAVTVPAPPSGPRVTGMPAISKVLPPAMVHGPGVPAAGEARRTRPLVMPSVVSATMPMDPAKPELSPDKTITLSAETLLAFLMESEVLPLIGAVILCNVSPVFAAVISDESSMLLAAVT